MLGETPHLTSRCAIQFNVTDMVDEMHMGKTGEVIANLDEEDT